LEQQTKMRAIATAAEKLAAGAEYHCDCLSITMSSNQRAASPEVWSSLDMAQPIFNSDGK